MMTQGCRYGAIRLEPSAPACSSGAGIAAGSRARTKARATGPRHPTVTPVAPACRGTTWGGTGAIAVRFPTAADTLDADPGDRIPFHGFVVGLRPQVAICDDARRFDTHPVLTGQGD